jgi:glycerophosphoryl diester phosphodiesterase
MIKPLIVARCGDLQNAPESTFPAFEGAIAKGADAIEFDVHLTKDEKLVVHHDYYPGRTNQGSGHIGDYTLAELKALDVGGWFDVKFAGERMPTLSEVFDLGKGRIRFEIDMRSPSLIFLNRVIDEIARFGVTDDVELTSAHVPLLFHVKRINPKLRTGIFFRALPDWMEPALGQEHVIGWMMLTDAQVAHLPSSLIEGWFIQRLHKRNFLVHGSNLNTEEEIREAIMLGIDQFSTDQLELALNIQEELREGP